MKQFLLFALIVALAKAETFHFELENDSLTCDDATLLEMHLKTFNLLCIDGLGCERGGGVLGGVAHTAEHAIPTTMHVLIHGCHYFDQICPDDEFDGFISLCNDVGSMTLEDKELCSGFEKEGRFGVGLPFPKLNPLAPVLDTTGAMVEYSIDGINFCSAHYAITLGGAAAPLLGVGAPLVGVGVSFLVGASMVFGLYHKKRRASVIDNEAIKETCIPKEVETNPAVAAVGPNVFDEEQNTKAAFERMKDNPSLENQKEFVRQSHFDRIAWAKQANERKFGGMA